MLRALNREDASVAGAVRRALPAIARAVDAAASALRNGERLFYVGAGTSGRLAALDAAECPPTFGTSPKQVQAVLAGGKRALTGAVEGAEDSARNGARDLARCGVSRGDVVAGIAASGETPYVLGAIQYAKRRGAVTIGVTFEPRLVAWTARAHCDCRTDGPRSGDGLHAAQSGDGAKDGPQPAINRSDDTAREGLRQLDDRRGADESQVASARRADFEGSKRGGSVSSGTCPASIRTRPPRGADHAESGSECR